MGVPSHPLLPEVTLVVYELPQSSIYFYVCSVLCSWRTPQESVIQTKTRTTLIEYMLKHSTKKDDYLMFYWTMS